MSPQAGYLLQEEVVPRLASAIPNAVACIGCEDAEELIQDGTAIAAKMMHNAELAGKQVVKSAGGQNKNSITVGNVAYYTIEKLRSGRRSTGSTVADVHGAGTQIVGNTRLSSLDDEVPTGEEGGEELQLHDVLSNAQEDPATQAACSVPHSFRELFPRRFGGERAAVMDCAVVVLADCSVEISPTCGADFLGF